ncbi:MAG TPA: tetratricopeptide repeat protein [Blastocatellia bacterium]|jgi:tetratricopeptide (TPR) repeat protein|nr:tetratricopeptide repeat protein [Blastocatellia bacterium]
MTSRAFITLIIVVLLHLPLAVDARAQQGNNIRGKVRDSSGKNVSSIIVELQTGNGLTINQIVTGNEGDFYFAGLKDTSYFVVISNADYNPVNERIEFYVRPGENNPGETRSVEITLVLKGGVRGPMAGIIFTQPVPQAARDAFARAMKLSKEGKREEAAAAMREAIKIYPDYFDAHFALGNELMVLNRLDEAIAEFEEARRVNPKDHRVYQSFGLIMMTQKKYAVAAAAFAEAARLNPNDAAILLRRATALIDHASTMNPTKSKEASSERDRALDMAEKDLTRAYDLSGRKLASVHLQMARLYEKRGERSRAADELEEYLHMVPEDKNAIALREAIKKLRTNQ